ncbi:hypothetical protein IMG5_190510, partial [Ichthyophthirius multifiliis]
ERFIFWKNLKENFKKGRTLICQLFLLAIQNYIYLIQIIKNPIYKIIMEEQEVFEEILQSLQGQIKEILYFQKSEDFEVQLDVEIIKFMQFMFNQLTQILNKESSQLFVKILGDCMYFQQNNEENSFIYQGKTLSQKTVLGSLFQVHCTEFVNEILQENIIEVNFIGEIKQVLGGDLYNKMKNFQFFNLEVFKNVFKAFSFLVFYQSEEVQPQFLENNLLQKIAIFLQNDCLKQYDFIKQEEIQVNRNSYLNFVSELLEILNSLFERNTKRSERRVATQIAKSVINLKEFRTALAFQINKIEKKDEQKDKEKEKDEEGEKQTFFLTQSAFLISNICRENPNLIEKFLEEDEGLIQLILKKLKVIEVSKNMKENSSIMWFLYHICLKEIHREEVFKSGVFEYFFDEIFLNQKNAEKTYMNDLVEFFDILGIFYSNIKEFQNFFVNQMPFLLKKYNKEYKIMKKFQKKQFLKKQIQKKKKMRKIQNKIQKFQVSNALMQ